MDMNVMFSAVDDPCDIKVGDLVYWPAEKSTKVMHLHGSASTMRGLGFSVGRRWRAIKYEDLKNLFQDDPERPRLLLVNSIIEQEHPLSERDARTVSLYSMSLTAPSRRETPAPSIVNVTELPLEFFSSNFRSADLLWGFSYEAGIVEKWLKDAIPDAPSYTLKSLDPRSLTGALLYHVQEFINGHRGALNVEKELVNPGRPPYFSYRESPFEENGQTTSDKDSHVAQILDAAHNALAVHSPRTSRLDCPPTRSSGPLPTEVVKNASKYGAKVLRPTDKFREMYAKAFKAYVDRKVSEHLVTLCSHAKNFMDTLRQGIKEYTDKSAELEASAAEGIREWSENIEQFNKLMKGGMQ